MKYLMRKIGGWLTVAGLSLAIGCHGYLDPATIQPDNQGGGNNQGGQGQTDPIVPVDELRLSADKTTIQANGSDKVTFKVLFGTEEGNKDVSTAKTMYLIRTLDGVEEQMASAANAFTTTKAGTYTFKARYYYNGEKFSNEVTVTATPAENTGVNYYKKLYGMQFTSVGCQNCPTLSVALSQIREQDPQRMAVGSYHMDFGSYSDPMSHPITQTYLNNFGVSGLPRFFIDLRKDSETMASKPAIERTMERILTDNPALCGVAIESTLSGSSLTVRAKFTSTLSTSYRYEIILVEDGIEEFQLGTTGISYTHNNVVRHVNSGNTYGARLNNGQPLEAGVEFTEEQTISLNSAWNAEKMRVIVLANTSTDGGSTWVTTNCNECKVGESADYLYEGEEPTPPTPPTPGDEGDNFVRHHAVMDFTGAWCTNCPDGVNTLNMIVEQMGPETIHVIALHDNTGGGDPMATPLTNTIFNDFKLTGYPSFVINLEEGGTLTSEWSKLRTYLRGASATSHCGIAITTDYNSSSRNGSATVKVKSAGEGNYRVSLFLLEDGVVSPQKHGSLTREDYIHNHVMRQMLSTTYQGDRLGEATAGQELTKSYNYTISSDYVAENCTFCALVIDGETGFVVNVAVCNATGGSADYHYAE